MDSVENLVANWQSRFISIYRERDNYLSNVVLIFLLRLYNLRCMYFLLTRCKAEARQSLSVAHPPISN